MAMVTLNHSNLLISTTFLEWLMELSGYCQSHAMFLQFVDIMNVIWIVGTSMMHANDNLCIITLLQFNLLMQPIL